MTQTSPVSNLNRMLNQARQRVIDALRIPRSAVLATSGPAGLQVSEFPCQADGLELFLLLPKTSDHLFNLEQDPAVSLLTPSWELKGEARLLAFHQAGQELFPEAKASQAGEEWYILVRIEPRQLQIRREGAQPGWGNLETIDLITIH